MNTLVLESEPLARDISVNQDALIVELMDGRTFMIPLAWYPRLFHATEAERNHFRIIGGGYALEWPDLDEHIGIEGLIAGRHSGESQASLQNWLASR